MSLREIHTKQAHKYKYNNLVLNCNRWKRNFKVKWVHKQGAQYGQYKRKKFSKQDHRRDEKKQGKQALTGCQHDI